MRGRSILVFRHREMMNRRLFTHALYCLIGTKSVRVSPHAILVLLGSFEYSQTHQKLAKTNKLPQMRAALWNSFGPLSGSTLPSRPSCAQPLAQSLEHHPPVLPDGLPTGSSPVSDMPSASRGDLVIATRPFGWQLPTVGYHSKVGDHAS